MKWTVALLCAGCVAALLAIFAVGTASAAVVPFSGIEYSWLHHNDDGTPIADWIKRISDLAPVRNGDVMQFQNRWYNNYAGTTDIKINYGGDERNVCVGADEYVTYGLNYGNYFPSSSESRPYYCQVVNCNMTPRTLLVTHQYIYNGITYGTINPDNDYTMLFQWRYGPDAEATITPTATPIPTVTVAPTPTAAPTVTARPSSPATPTATVKPDATATIKPSATPIPLPSASSPGFGFDQLLALVAVLIIAGVSYRIVKNR